MNHVDCSLSMRNRLLQCLVRNSFVFFKVNFVDIHCTVKNVLLSSRLCTSDNTFWEIVLHSVFKFVYLWFPYLYLIPVIITRNLEVKMHFIRKFFPFISFNMLTSESCDYNKIYLKSLLYCLNYLIKNRKIILKLLLFWFFHFHLSKMENEQISSFFIFILTLKATHVYSTPFLYPSPILYPTQILYLSPILYPTQILFIFPILYPTQIIYLSPILYPTPILYLTQILYSTLPLSYCNPIFYSDTLSYSNIL